MSISTALAGPLTFLWIFNFSFKEGDFMIKIDNARKIYTDEVKIGPLNIEIPKAGLTSLIGTNCAGKSTTLLMIGRLLDMDSEIWTDIFETRIEIIEGPYGSIAIY